MKELKIKIQTGISRGKDTYGYAMLTARDVDSNVRLGHVCGGNYDMINSVLCEAISNRFQDQLRAALEGIDLTGTGSGDHPYYCFHRDAKGEIIIDGAGGSNITAKACRVLGLSLNLISLNPGLYLVTLKGDAIK